MSNVHMLVNLAIIAGASLMVENKSLASELDLVVPFQANPNVLHSIAVSIATKRQAIGVIRVISL